MHKNTVEKQVVKTDETEKRVCEETSEKGYFCAEELSLERTDEEHSDEYYAEYIQNFRPNLKKKRGYRFFKRLFDIVSSFLGLLILLLPIAVIALAIKIDSKGPVIFRQERMGRNKKPFVCYKFRSMRTDAPHDCPTSQLGNAESYISRVGKVLRKLSLDEIPQLFNVLKGDMSLIGPRPVVLTEEKLIEMRDRLGVYRARPGISGYAQIHGRDEVYYKNKAILDAEYVNKASLWFDFKLLVKTFLCVFKREGVREGKAEQNKAAYAEPQIAEELAATNISPSAPEQSENFHKGAK